AGCSARTRAPPSDGRGGARGCPVLHSDAAAALSDAHLAAPVRRDAERSRSAAASAGEARPLCRGATMNLGAFSISLAVKDLSASRDFYMKFGFTPFAGDPEQHWQILKNGDHVIGLLQGMFERNLLTFNPGWVSAAD